METPAPHRLMLEIATNATSVAGRMSDENGVTVEFGGWLEFAAALQRLLNDEPRTEGAAP